VHTQRHNAQGRSANTPGPNWRSRRWWRRCTGAGSRSPSSRLIGGHHCPNSRSSRMSLPVGGERCAGKKTANLPNPLPLRFGSMSLRDAVRPLKTGACGAKSVWLPISLQ